MKRIVVISSLCVTFAGGLLLAGPAEKLDPVAKGYPDWKGLSENGYVSGREICASDLRHKMTTIIEIEPGEKLEEQLLLVSAIVSQGSSSVAMFWVDWANLEIPRDSIVLISSCGSGGMKEHAMIQEVLKAKGKDEKTAQRLATCRSRSCSIYDNVTFTGAPDGSGKRPFVYVMGPEGTEPLFQGQVTKDSIREAIAVIQKGKKQISEKGNKWKPFYGNVPEPKFHPQLAKAVEKGRSGKASPLEPVAKAILKDVNSADAEKAREAQILFDAINQTRDDLELRIRLEISECPHRAYYDIQELLKYWPTAKKRVEALYARIKGNPDIEVLAKMFCKITVWGDPSFVPRNAADVKKITQELNKMKKSLKELKESKNIQVQNAASLIDVKVDELLAVMTSKNLAK